MQGLKAGYIIEESQEEDYHSPEFTQEAPVWLH